MSLLRVIFIFVLVTGGFSYSAGQAATPSAPDKSSAAAVQSSNFEKSRRLMDQGQYDEAIAPLHGLSAKDPASTALAPQLGTPHSNNAHYTTPLHSPNTP